LFGPKAFDTDVLQVGNQSDVLIGKNGWLQGWKFTERLLSLSLM